MEAQRQLNAQHRFQTFCRIWNDWRQASGVEAIIAAVFVASLIVILKSYGMLDRVKVATLNAVSSAYSSSTYREGEVSGDADGLFEDVFVLKINQEVYESVFDQSSPLDRQVLARFFSSLVNDPPSVLAIDFDLSPNPSADFGENTSCAKGSDAELMCALVTLADAGTKIVLLIPEPMYSDAAREVKSRWMIKMLEHKNISFGLGSIYSLDGAVLKYFNAGSSFSAATFKARWLSCDDLSSLNDNEAMNSMTKQVMLSRYDCSAMQGQKEKIDLILNRDWRNAIDVGSVFGVSKYLQPFNYSFFGSARIHGVDVEISTENVGQKNIQINESLKSKVVFFGGDYGLTDYYNTPSHRKSGIDLHVAAYLSMHNPVGHEENIIPFLLEVIFGAILGFILHKVLAHHYLVGHVFFRIIIVAGVVCYSVGLVFLSYKMLEAFNFWINPAPLMIGVVVHELAGFVNGESHSQAAGHTVLNEGSYKTGVPSSLHDIVYLAALASDRNNEHKESNASFYKKSNSVLKRGLYVSVIGYAIVLLICKVQVGH